MLMNCLSQTAVNAAPGLLNLVSLCFTLRSNSGLARLSSACPRVKPTLMIAFAKLCRLARNGDKLAVNGSIANVFAARFIYLYNHSFDDFARRRDSLECCYAGAIMVMTNTNLQQLMRSTVNVVPAVVVWSVQTISIGSKV